MSARVRGAGLVTSLLVDRGSRQRSCCILIFLTIGIWKEVDLKEGIEIRIETGIWKEGQRGPEKKIETRTAGRETGKETGRETRSTKEAGAGILFVLAYVIVVNYHY